jgi:hypothetical protein
MRFREILEAIAPTPAAPEGDIMNPNSVFSRVMSLMNTPADDAKDDGKGGAKGSPGAATADLTTIQDPDFNTKLQKVATALGVNANDILTVMKRESRVDPKAINPKSGASGLIQFMPKTAKSLGTSVEAIRQMSAVEQLDYVYLYYKSVGVRPGMNAEDLYLATFMPAALGKPDNTVLGQKGAEGFSGQVYAQNAGIDKRGTGAITVADIKNFVKSA